MQWTWHPAEYGQFWAVAEDSLRQLKIPRDQRICRSKLPSNECFALGFFDESPKIAAHMISESICRSTRSAMLCSLRSVSVCVAHGMKSSRAQARRHASTGLPSPCAKSNNQHLKFIFMSHRCYAEQLRCTLEPYSARGCELGPRWYNTKHA